MAAGREILIIDDEPQIQRFLRHALEAAGYDLHFADRGSTALQLAASVKPDLIILDLGLPDMDGKVLLGQLRQRLETPVIVLSARDDEAEKVAALDLGANDYVEKPFGIGELLARIRAALRPKKAQTEFEETIRLGTLTIDPARHQVLKDGIKVKLTPTEFELLLLLGSNAGRVLTHRYILTNIWGPAHTEDVAYLRVFIGQLRQKVEDDPARPTIIVTETGVGYRARNGH
jgi:two-component system KDP operon response regulator KdpE